MTSVAHLARRWATSLSRREPSAAERVWAHGQMLPAEREWWDRMTVQDRRHSLLVAHRFVQLLPDADRAEVAAALLHDVGKVHCGLGTWGRVLATVVGPRGERFRTYHDHERLGAELLAAVDSAAVTVDLVQGRGRAAEALRRADDV